MALVTVGHPIPGLTAYERFDDFSLAFVGGISGRINLTAGQQSQLTGLGYVINPATPAYESPYVLDAELADPNSAASVALRAAYGTFVNVRSYGAKGDDATDDTAAIQAAIEAARPDRRAVYVPAGKYRISSTLLLPSNVTFFGDGTNRTTITQTTAGIPTIASRAWSAASNYGPGGGTEIRHMRINGAAGAGAHGIVLRDFYSTIADVHVYDAGGNGVHVTDKNDQGTPVGSTLVENRIQDVVCNRCVGWGIYVGDTDTVATTDGFLSGIVVQSRSSEAGGSLGGIRFGSAAGWQIRQIHTYGAFSSYGLDVARAWHTVIDGAQIERGWTGVGLRLGGYQRGSSLDNISISCGSSGGTALSVSGTTDTTYVADGVSMGSVTVIQDFDTAATAIEWNRSRAQMTVGSLSLQGTYQQRITRTGGTGAANITIAALEAGRAIGLGSMTDGVASMPRLLATSGVTTMTSGTLRLAYFNAPQQLTAANVRIVSGATAAGATPTLCRVGLYEVAANGDMTLIASTANDTTLFAGANTSYVRPLDVPVDVRPGRRYAIGALVVTAATAPTMYGATALNGTEMSLSPRVSALLTVQTDLPATISNSLVSNSASVIYAALTA